MKPLILILILLSSCAIADKLEETHDILWNNTKALRVKSVEKVVTLESFSNPARTYTSRTDTLQVGDTVILTDDIRITLKIKSVK